MPTFLDKPTWYDDSGALATATPIIETSETNPDNLPKDVLAYYHNTGAGWTIFAPNQSPSNSLNCQHILVIPNATTSCATQIAECTHAAAKTAHARLIRYQDGAQGTWGLWRRTTAVPYESNTIPFFNAGSEGSLSVSRATATYTGDDAAVPTVAYMKNNTFRKLEFIETSFPTSSQDTDITSKFTQTQWADIFEHPEMYCLIQKAGAAELYFTDVSYFFESSIQPGTTTTTQPVVSFKGENTSLSVTNIFYKLNIIQSDSEEYSANLTYGELPTPKVNNNKTDIEDIFAPTASGTAGYLLQSNGTNSIPTWVSQDSVRAPKVEYSGTGLLDFTSVDEGTYLFTTTIFSNYITLLDYNGSGDMWNIYTAVMWYKRGYWVAQVILVESVAGDNPYRTIRGYGYPRARGVTSEGNVGATMTCTRF